MENDQREHLARLQHLARLLEDVKGDPKTSVVLVVMLDAIIQAVAGRCAGCQDCGSTQGAAEAEAAKAQEGAQ